MISAGARRNSSHIRLAVLLLFLPPAPRCVQVQSGRPDETWAGRRIVTPRGFADYFVSDEHGQSELIQT